MFDENSEQEFWIQNKASELPNFEKKKFISENENKNNEPNIQHILNDIINPTIIKMNKKLILIIQ